VKIWKTFLWEGGKPSRKKAEDESLRGKENPAHGHVKGHGSSSRRDTPRKDKKSPNLGGKFLRESRRLTRENPAVQPKKKKIS